MKQYAVYRHIRGRALIFGLPVAFFALQLLAVIGSLMAVIFSFDLVLLFGAMVANGILYGLLLKWAQRPEMLRVGNVFPDMISNKKITIHETYDEPS
ncbi:hypothetical protein K1F50_15600 [Muricauda oceani]|uniref:Uncharacterized protein n=1 Tax=Flagellimonas oceani TaxID=2698672 RepID=A0A6G7J0U3_9FLAO|nr:hypothetical protein [Allomuricauda oceani]MBW8244233.1 hypothetical protein [Allomuricauda oceani]QII44117.1 hypothetical protein GVT53_05330 [Allomuricauda oceani]